MGSNGVDGESIDSPPTMESWLQPHPHLMGPSCQDAKRVDAPTSQVSPRELVRSGHFLVPA
jgi:hypothetical protein